MRHFEFLCWNICAMGIHSLQWLTVEVCKHTYIKTTLNSVHKAWENTLWSWEVWKVYSRCSWPIGQVFIIMRYCLHKIVSHSEMYRSHLKDFLILHNIFLRTDFDRSIKCLVWFKSRSDHLQSSNIRFDHNVSAYKHSLQSKKISNHTSYDLHYPASTKIKPQNHSKTTELLKSKLFTHPYWRVRKWIIFHIQSSPQQVKQSPLWCRLNSYVTVYFLL